MSFRTTLFLLACLLVLAVSYAFVRSNHQSPASQRELFSSAMLDEVKDIRLIRSEEEPLQLKKEGESWLIQDFPADEVLVEQLLDQLAGQERGQQVSRNPDNWGQYGVMDGAQEMVIVDPAGKERRLVFGVPAPGGLYYLRYDDQPEVYVARTELLGAFRSDLDRWREKHMLPSDLVPVSLTSRIGDERWMFEKQEGEWVYLNGEEVVELDQEIFDGYWNSLSSLKASGFEPDGSLFVSADNALSVTAESGEEYVISIDVLDDGVVAQVTGFTELLRLGSDMASRLRPGFLEQD